MLASDGLSGTHTQLLSRPQRAEYQKKFGSYSVQVVPSLKYSISRRWFSTHSCRALGKRFLEGRTIARLFCDRIFLASSVRAAHNQCATRVPAHLHAAMEVADQGIELANRGAVALLNGLGTLVIGAGENGMLGWNAPGELCFL